MGSRERQAAGGPDRTQERGAGTVSETRRGQVVTRRQLTHLFVNLIAGTAVLIAVYSGNPWAGLVPCVLFVFVFFPRWRRKIEVMIGKLIESLRGRNDSCGPE